MVNVAELLKDAPEGTELWCTLYGRVYFISVDPNKRYPIQIRLNDNTKVRLDRYGKYYDNFEQGECILFPSKNCRTWEGWKIPIEPKFKIGDWVVFNNSHNSIYQISEINDSYYVLTHTHGGSMSLPFTQEKLIRPWTIQDAIDGDVLVTDFFIFLFKKVDYANGVHYYCHCGAQGEEFDIALPDSLMGRVGNSLINYRPATKEQRDLLFAKMKEADYKWNEKNKVLLKIKYYDITNFKPKQWVLVRDDDEWEWALTRFSHLSNGSASLFVCINGASFQQCIPFEGNERLLGTTDPCPKEFINW